MVNVPYESRPLCIELKCKCKINMTAAWHHCKFATAEIQNKRFRVHFHFNHGLGIRAGWSVFDTKMMTLMHYLSNFLDTDT